MSACSTAAGADTEQIQIERALRELAPQVLGALVRRHGASTRARTPSRRRCSRPRAVAARRACPTNPRGWLIAVATRRLIDALRSEQRARRASARRHGVAAPRSTPSAEARDEDDTLTLLFLCCHPGADAGRRSSR